MEAPITTSDHFVDFTEASSESNHAWRPLARLQYIRKGKRKKERTNVREEQSPGTPHSPNFLRQRVPCSGNSDKKEFQGE